MTVPYGKRNGKLAGDRWRLTRTIVFVGLMGAGKTRIGRRVAKVLGVPFFDSDHEVEAAAGMSVSDIFRVHGEKAFREAEQKVIRRLLAGSPCVIATGGGAYMNDSTRAMIGESATSIWLRATLPVLHARTSRSNKRPLLQNGDAWTILNDLIEKRYPIYAAAELIVDSEDTPPEITAQAAMAALKEKGLIVAEHD